MKLAIIFIFCLQCNYKYLKGYIGLVETPL